VDLLVRDFDQRGEKHRIGEMNSSLGCRIAVVGPSGSGKSRVARLLAGSLGLRHVCKDALIWGADWQPTPHSEWAALFNEATAENGWVFDGNLSSLTNPEDQLVAARADTIVWIDLPRWLVMWQIVLRSIRRAWTREELWHGNRESWKGSFLSRDSVILWAWTSYPVLRERYSHIFAKGVGSEDNPSVKVRLRSRRAIEQWLAKLGRPMSSRRE
jgi:adenylate kinase family enzyme